ncbi:MAG: hypothetical protein JW803_00205 [Endomicrobiales bacterium]|nr:hypothetical protein [Endomicrobiales bacterium]
MRKTVYIGLLSVLLLGCAAKKNYLIDTFDYSQAYFEGLALNSFNIVDERVGVSDIVSFPLKKKEASLFPALTPEHRELIKRETERHLSTEGSPVDLTVFVKKGEKGYKSRLTGKFEEVKFAVKMEFKLKDRTEYASGEALLEIKSMSVSHEYLEKLYQKAIRESIHQCFVTLKG